MTDDGKAGSTSSSLADRWRGRTATTGTRQSDVADADVVVITMGANDLCPGAGRVALGLLPRAPATTPRSTRWRRTWAACSTGSTTCVSGHARVLVTTYWNVFTDGRVARKAERQGYLAWSDTVTRRANVGHHPGRRLHGATLVDLYAPFKGDGSVDPTNLLAGDGDHPTAAGTATISRGGPGRVRGGSLTVPQAPKPPCPSQRSTSGIAAA